MLSDWLGKVTLLGEPLDSHFTGLFFIPRDGLAILGNGFVIQRKVLHELYVNGGFKGAPGTHSHLSSQFLSFSCSFWEKN